MPDVKEIPPLEEATKASFRNKIWNHIMKNELGYFPLSVLNRIPNFKGAAEAAQRLVELDEFKKAKIIKINPDKPQEPVRLLALEANKELLVPIPRLKSGLFLHVPPGVGTDKEELKNIATRRGVQEFGKPLGLDSDIKVDLVVFGAVCVSRSGYRIGKAEGFADLEYAVMRQMGAIDENTTVITTVHDCQIVDDLPTSLFEKFDVPVDMIVTPTQTIIVGEKLKKPTGIFWDMLTPRRVKSMQILQQLRQIDEKNGKTVLLKEEDASDERRRFEKSWVKRIKNKRRLRAKRQMTNADAACAVDGEPVEAKEENKEKRGRVSRKRRLPDRKGDADRESSANDNNTDEQRKEQPQRRRKSFKPRPKPNIDFSLKLSNIKSDVRVRHLKDALIERGVRPSDISWHGHRGYCYLHFGKLRNKDSQPDQPVQVDSIVANLQQLRLGETTVEEGKEFVVVEPAKPITRIEITDVSAV